MTRYVKILLIAMLAGWAILVVFNNVVDYGTNYSFVEHVLRMDTVFSESQVAYRAINAPILWHLAYLTIIVSEAFTGLLLAVGALRLWQARASAERFNGAKTIANSGLIAGLVLWFLGFTVIGAEWFLMWQSEIWNGQGGAFRFYMTFLGALIFLNQPDADDG
ncbi:DUF2165 family protein [Pseudomonas abietaniphila]|jgi:predicted small integral membrane protein